MLGTNFAGTTEEGVTLVAAAGRPVDKWKKTGQLKARSSQEEVVINLLHEAAKTGNLEVMRSLVLEAGVNPNSRDEKGWTALLRATKCNEVQVVDFLVAEKADPDAQTRQGNTALHKAAKRSRVDVARALVRGGAKLDTQNKGKATPLMLACMSKGSDPIVSLLVQMKCNLDLQKDVGYTALMVAARCGNGHALSELLQAKARVDMRDRSGESALDKAAKSQKDEAVQMLQMAGAVAHKRHNPKEKRNHTGTSDAAGLKAGSSA